jgi:hypothetical protein
LVPKPLRGSAAADREDQAVIRLNRQGQAAMRRKNEQRVAALATDWFRASMKATLA